MRYNPTRGARVIAWATDFLDKAVPLVSGSHGDATAYTVNNGQLSVTLANGGEIGIRDDKAFRGYNGTEQAPESILFCNNGLHIELQIDKEHQIGKDSSAGIKDVLLESALTTIQDCEDSVAAVDADDKIVVYRNWLGLMKGDLSADLSKGGKTIKRQLNPDRHYKGATGGSVVW